MKGEPIRVKIGGMYYRIVSDDDAEYVQKIARKANELLAEMRRDHSGLNDVAIAALALLNALDYCEQLQAKDGAADQYRQDMAEAMEKLEAERMRLREQLWEMKKDLLYYRNLCDLYEDKLSSFSSASVPTKSAKVSSTKAKPLDLRQRSFVDMPDYERSTDE